MALAVADRRKNQNSGETDSVTRLETDAVRAATERVCADVIARSQELQLMLIRRMTELENRVETLEMAGKVIKAHR